MLLLLSSFSAFFPDVSFLIYKENSRFAINTGNYWICKCFFITISSQDSGGAISVSNSQENCFLIENCAFSGCNCVQNGGGIYFLCTNGAIVLKCTTAVACQTGGSHGQFSYLKAASNRIMEGHFVGISFCSPKQANQYAANMFISSMQRWNSLNSSYNHLRDGCGVRFDAPTSSYSSFLTISCNIANYICVDFCDGSSEMSNSNIVNNSNTASSYGVVINYGQSSALLKLCILVGNLQIGGGSLVYLMSGSLVLENCWIQSGGNNAITKNCYGETSTYIINHYRQCIDLTRITARTINHFMFLIGLMLK